MAVQYIDTNRQNTTFVPTNKQDLINHIETVLLAAGWTTVSGSGTTNLLVQSALSPQNLQMRLRCKDNGGTCVTLSIQNVAGTKVQGSSTTAGVFLDPGASSKTYRIVANAYQAFILTNTVPTPAREFAAFGVPYLPDFLVGVVTEAIWIHGNAANDTATTILSSFATGIRAGDVGNTTVPNQCAICNGNIWEVANAPAPSGSNGVGWITAQPCTIGVASGFRWHDLSAVLTDALIGWGLTGGNNVEAQWRGQLWDCLVSTEQYSAGLTFTADSHTWYVVSNLGGTTYRGSIMLAIG